MPGRRETMNRWIALLTISINTINLSHSFTQQRIPSTAPSSPSSSSLSSSLLSSSSTPLKLEYTSSPPLLDVPTYSLATLTINPDNNNNNNNDNDDIPRPPTGMNILTYATPISVRPDRMWCIGLFKGTMAHDNFAKTGWGVLQLLPKTEVHSQAVRILGGCSGLDRNTMVNKKEECAKIGLEWKRVKIIQDEYDDEEEKEGEVGKINGEHNDAEEEEEEENLEDILPELLPGCVSYICLSLVGEMIDCGSHDAAICKVVSMFTDPENDESNVDENEDSKSTMNTAFLRQKGVITNQGKVSNSNDK